MNVIFNNCMLDSEVIDIGIDNRALQYGDGLFETLICKEAEIQYLEDHLERLHRGMRALKMIIPSSLVLETVKINIQNLLKTNNLENAARIKLIVWRKAGGYFAPLTNEVEYIITCSEHKKIIPTIRRVDFCNSVQISKSPYSEFKRCSSLSYVLAGIEMQERQLDDLILLDGEGNIAECIYSNIFWITDDCFFTPSLDTGCISGIRRKKILTHLQQLGKTAKIVKTQPSELIKADYIFSCNVAGLYPITHIGRIEFRLLGTDFLEKIV